MVYRLLLCSVLLGVAITPNSANAQVCNVFFDIECTELSNDGTTACEDLECFEFESNQWTCPKPLVARVLEDSVTAVRTANPGESGYWAWTTGDKVVCSVLEDCTCDYYHPTLNTTCNTVGESTELDVFYDSDPVTTGPNPGCAIF